MSNPMPEQPHSNISLSESEIRDILTKMVETNPLQIPVLLLQIQFERFMLQVVDKLMSELKTSIKQLESTIYNN
jgi:hypothetical protein